jgi:uncharacterized metal-binding protein YceD (DUF177 family)
VDRLPARGTEAVVEATPEEREALARDFGLAAIHALKGTFRVAGDRRRLTVTGRVEATVTQVCVVTLDPFDSSVSEDVDVAFTEAREEPLPEEMEITGDLPDEIVDGRVDLGSLAAEFLALGLDPHPRKPGVSFEDAPEPAGESPFAALARLKPEG